MGFLRGIHRRAGRGGLDKDVSPLFRNSPTIQNPSSCEEEKDSKKGRLYLFLFFLFLTIVIIISSN
ncbi:hypothetical protein A2247_00035 [candidate division WOR-1 bacterium RIFOXYA2_FULL_41_14]|nr:MAG: hypothetical protein A2247_00035 [candidate division WOR-1 bacterium RIFOXYA2_FULL_41_14]